MKEPIKLEVRLRHYGGTNIARCNGQVASHTGNEDVAVERAAAKAIARIADMHDDAAIEQALRLTQGAVARAREAVACGSDQVTAIRNAVGQCGSSVPVQWDTRLAGLRGGTLNDHLIIPWSEVAAHVFSGQAELFGGAK